MALVTGELSAKATKVMATESADALHAQIHKDLTKGGLLPTIKAPDNITDTVALAELAGADVAMRNAILSGQSVQKMQSAAAATWLKLGVSKADASLRIDAICHHLTSQGHEVPSPRSIKSRALEAAGYEKDEAKSKARKARKGKGKVISPVDRVIACARHHAKGDAAVIKLLKAALATLE